MTYRKNDIPLRPLFFAVLGALFCFWSVQGNDVNFCNTAGCTLYRDVSVAGLSLWWYGLGVFSFLGLLALLGTVQLALFVSGCALLADIFLLALMSITAPCLNCLIVGLCFALTYRSFSHQYHERRRMEGGPASSMSHFSLLLTLWLFFFCLNVGAVLRYEVGPWAVYGESETAHVHLYFSPSCPHCRDAVFYYAGSVDTAFYPLADDDSDLYKTYALTRHLSQGKTLEEALKACQDAPSWDFLHNFSPDILLLELRMLRNKAHVFNAGSQGVPFFEYHGMPALVQKAVKNRRRILELKDEPEQAGSQDKENEASQGMSEPSHDLPLELTQPPLTGKQCTGQSSCP